MNKKVNLPRAWDSKNSKDEFYLPNSAADYMWRMVEWSYPAADRRNKMRVVEEMAFRIKLYE